MMKQVYVEDISKGAYLRTVPIPTPGPGEVLVKMMLATIMPIDNAMNSTPAFPPPYVLGPQGAGLIVAAGTGVDKSCIGRKAVVYSGLLRLTERTWQGNWTQYVARKFEEIYVCDQSISYEQAAGMYGNPLTAMGAMRTAERLGTRGTILSAACSEICKKIAMMHREKGIPTINLVRGETNVAILKALGEALVVDVKAPGFEAELKMLIDKYQPNVFIDSVGDEVAQKTFEIMPPRSTLVLFGGLGKAATFPVPVLETVVKEKTVTGYFWSLEDHRKPIAEIKKELDVVNADLKSGGKRFAAPVIKIYPLEDFMLALKEQPKFASQGRCLLKLNEY